MTGKADRKEIIGELSAFLLENRGLDPALITEDAKLGDLGLDSIALADLSFGLFATQGIMLDDGIILYADTIGDLVDVIAKHISDHPSDRP
jgi:acyl carrier protein